MIAKRCAVRCVLLLSAGLALVATSPARAENPEWTLATSAIRS